MTTARQHIIETEIPVSQLQIGMHVIRLDRPWEDTDFLLQGFILQTEEDVLAVQQQCERVTVEGKVHVVPEPLGQSPVGRRRTPDKTGSYRQSQSSSSIPKRKVTYVNKVDASREMSAARMSYTEAKATAKNIMSSLRLGRTLEMNHIHQVVDSCVDSVLRNDNALLLLTKIKNKDEYTAEHCIDDEILNKPGALTPEEFAVMKKHTTFGRDLLASLPRLAHSAVDVEMANEEVGIVVATHTTSKLKPRVLLVRDADKHPLATFREVDLLKDIPDSAGQPYKIAREVPDESYGIVMKDFIEQGILNRKAPEVSAPVDDGHGEP